MDVNTAHLSWLSVSPQTLKWRVEKREKREEREAETQFVLRHPFAFCPLCYSRLSFTPLCDPHISLCAWPPFKTHSSSVFLSHSLSLSQSLAFLLSTTPPFLFLRCTFLCIIQQEPESVQIRSPIHGLILQHFFFFIKAGEFVSLLGSEKKPQKKKLFLLRQIPFLILWRINNDSLHIIYTL